MNHKLPRKLTSVFLALVFAFAGFNPAMAAPPINDNFVDALLIDSLPFSVGVDNSEAGIESDEPQPCSFNSGTVWYAFTPSESMTLRVDIQGGSAPALVGVFRAEAPGITGLTNQTCMDIYSSPVTLIPIDSAFTYYFQVGAVSGAIGTIQLSIERVPPPPNNNFSDSIEITGLPFGSSYDNIGASLEPGEPYHCYGPINTIWYSYTAPNDAVLKVDMAGSSFGDTQVSVFQATGPGFEGLSFINCGSFGNPVIFNVQAGSVYYFQAGTAYSLGGDLQLYVYEVPPPANDHFSEATVISSTLPFTDSIETAGATVEAAEPTPSCGYFGLVGTAWYVFSPTESGSFSVRTSASFYTLTAVYSGDSLAGLTELGCSPFYGSPLSFTAAAGTTYYIQTGAMIPGQLQNGPLQIEFDVAPPPQAGFYYAPSYPSAFDTVQFYDSSSDPGGVGLQSFTWDFGDGTTSTDTYPTHRYASDGDYTVEHSVTTIDGRTASTSQVVEVRTHDVTVTSVTAPESAKVGRSGRITVSIVNTSGYTETVTVHLYRSVAGGGFEWIGDLTKPVSSTQDDELLTRFTFNYTFTTSDAEFGKVIFRAEATIDNAPDAFPQDNLQLSGLTRVRE